MKLNSFKVTINGFTCLVNAFEKTWSEEEKRLLQINYGISDHSDIAVCKNKKTGLFPLLIHDISTRLEYRQLCN